MQRLPAVMILSLAALGAAGCKPSPQKQCEDIYKKGNGEQAYATDKATFMDVCTKASDTARKCLLEKGKDRMKDPDCGPDNKSFDEQMTIMKTGQGTP